MAYVVAAQNIELDLSVAIKFLLPEHRTDELISRFAREARAMAKLRSEFVTRILDVGIDPELGPFIVMERLSGEDLRSAIERNGPLEIEVAVDFILMALGALSEAHNVGIVHRDIKPDNIYLHRGTGGEPVVKLLDFGVSQAALTGTTFGTSVDLVKTSALLGSPLYMAPEQIRGSNDLDARTDIWSVGAVLYECLTGQVPFNASSITELSAKVIEVDPAAPSRMLATIPSELDAVVLKCLAKRPEDRFQDVEGLAIALEPFGRQAFAMPTSRALRVIGEAPSSTRQVSQATPRFRESSTGQRPSLPMPSATVARISLQPELSAAALAAARAATTAPPAAPVLPVVPTPLPPAEVDPAPPPRRRALWVMVALLSILAVAAVMLILRERFTRPAAASAQTTASPLENTGPAMTTSPLAPSQASTVQSPEASRGEASGLPKVDATTRANGATGAARWAPVVPRASASLATTDSRSTPSVAPSVPPQPPPPKSTVRILDDKGQGNVQVIE